MFKRLFWMIIGAGVGLWGRKRAIDTTEKYVPEPIRRFAVRSARSLTDEVIRSVQETRAKAREAERVIDVASEEAPRVQLRRTTNG